MDSKQSSGWLATLFDRVYWLWAAAGPPLLAALVGGPLYLEFPSRAVLVGWAVAVLAGLVAGLRLAAYLRRGSANRGGMAGAMAAHATPELDDDTSD